MGDAKEWRNVLVAPPKVAACARAAHMILMLSQCCFRDWRCGPSRSLVYATIAMSACDGKM